MPRSPKREPHLQVANELAIRRALEEAGVEFTNGDKPGVRLVQPAEVRVIAEGTSKVAKKTKRSKASEPATLRKKLDLSPYFLSLHRQCPTWASAG